MKFTIMITTRNRREDLRRTCSMLAELDPPPDEVLVCADGCTDATAAMLRDEFPGFHLTENPVNVGSVGSRDRLLRLARGDVVVSLDDDSYPVDRDFLARVRRTLDAHPEAAVLSFPVLHDDGSHASPTEAPDSLGHYVPAYANCAAAMRRECYLNLAGFPRFFRHGYEEVDYALQCYGAGWTVWFEPGLTVRHHFSPVGRHMVRRQHLHARNELWSVLMRCPWPYLPAVALFRAWRQFRYACTQGFGAVVAEPMWWLSALTGLTECLRHREPIPWHTYWMWMKLARRPLRDRAGLAWPMLVEAP